MHFFRLSFIIALFLVSGGSWGATITTCAGTGVAGFSGDGGPATSAKLSHPSKITKDSKGNLYIAETGNHCIRKVTPDGTISTVAGSGEPGFSGDGGLATKACLDTPTDIAVDAAGDLYIADSSNHCIRKVSSSGKISTYVGKTAAFHKGVQHNTPRLTDIQSGFEGDGGPAGRAKLHGPLGIALDPNGDLYIADSLNRRIRKVGAKDGMIQTIAGDGRNGSRGDGGPAKDASFSLPTSLTLDRGILYIVDTPANNIRKIVLSTGQISTVLGTDARLKNPVDCFAKNGVLYVTDPMNSRIQKIDASGAMSAIVGTGNPGYNGEGIEADSAQLNFPGGVFVDASNNLFIADTLNQRIRVVLFEAK